MIEPNREHSVDHPLFLLADRSGDGLGMEPAVVVAGRQQLERPEIIPGHWHPTVGQMVKTRDDREWAKEHAHLPLCKKYRNYGFGKTPTLSPDGRIRPGAILDIRYLTTAACYEIETFDGHVVVVPEFQGVLTPIGPRLPMQLAAYMEVCVRGDFEGRLPREVADRLTAGARKGGGYAGQGFPPGSDNPAYVNGGASRFRQIREKLIAEIGACEICDQPHHRLEVHHRDRDRTNNARVNLQLLCPGCHKREEYKLGRTRRGERGHPIDVDVVTRVTPVGELEVFVVLLNADARGASVGRLVLAGGGAGPK